MVVEGCTLFMVSVVHWVFQNDEEASVDGEPRLTIVEEPEETDEAADEAKVASGAEDSAAVDQSAAPSPEDNNRVDTSTPVESMVISVDPFQATSCDSSTCWPQNLTVKKAAENSKPYTCEMCNKKFSDKSYMKTHQLTHLGVRPHACGYCGKAFFRRRELLRHEAVHTGVKPFQCKICQKAFARSDKLMRHERTHGNAQQHPCSHCPAKFVRKDDLTRHEMTHTGQKPHACSTCTKSFATKAELTRHEKTHALKEFKCEPCALVFPKKEKLSAHMRTHEAHQQLQLLDNVVDLRGLMAHCTRFGGAVVAPPAELHLVPLKQT